MERTELYGLPRQDFLFVLKNVSPTPTAPRQKEAVTIKGEVNLLKIPFFAPVWVIASVTYPEKWWEIVGSPIVHEMTVAIGGKFEIKFAEGFDREGEYTLAVNLYFGPTITTTLGTLKSLTLPPLPSLDTYEGKFTVSGEVPEEEINFTLGQPLINNLVQPTVTPGTTITITCPVTSQCTESQNIKVKCTIYEGSKLPGTGTKLAEYTSPLAAITPNETKNFSFSYQTTAGTIDRRDVGVAVLIDTKEVASNPFDDAFWVTAAALAFDLGQPLINNLIQPTNIALGTAITIVCPIISRCSSTQQITVKVNIDEGSKWFTPGSPIETFTSGPSSIAPNGTLNVVINTTAKGATDRKDIEVWVYVGGVEKAYKHFDDAFWVTPAGPAKGTVNFTNSYPVKVYVDFVYYGDTPLSVELFTGTHNWSAQDTAGNQNSGSFTLAAGQTLNIDVNVEAGGGDTGTLHITFTPLTATVTVDGSPVVNGGNYTLSAGYHWWVAQASGYYMDTAQFLILAGKTTNITILLIPLPAGYKLTTGVRPAGVGYVTRSPDKTLYVPGETVLLTAYRSVNYYYFDFWSGDASGTWGQIWVIMDKDKYVTANFKSTPYA